MTRILLLLALLASPAAAQHGDDGFDDLPPEPRRITAGADVTSGALRVAQGDAVYELPLMHTTVDAWISGLVAEVDVTQTYSNPFDTPIEATYLFPLPDQAAVHHMTMQVGERTITGEIKRRAEAREIYDRAKRRGQTAALLDQERPNVFTQRVANILPGESIEITISLAEVLSYEDGAWEWVMPLVVGPRYVPPSGTGTRGDDADAINPVMSEAPTGAEVDLRVQIDAGVPIRAVRSPSHALHISEDSADRVYVELDEDHVPNKDFILRYEVAGDAPQTGVLSSWSDQGGHFLLMIQPPADDQLQGMITPKDLVFLIDTSCSQSGAPMAAAKAAMHEAIGGLNPEDRYSILQFNSSVGPAVQGGFRDKDRGHAYVDTFSGGGGTNMLAGVRAALDLPKRDALRTILMITDGYVGNETQIFGSIEERLGRSRMFTLGTGSSVNRYLLDRAAKVGRGDVQVIRPDEDAGAAVAQFYDRIRNPLLTDIEVSWRGAELLDVHPDPMQDLFSGQPLMLLGRYDEAGTAHVTVSGRLGNKPWKKTVKVELRGEGGNPAIGSLWARRWIEDLEQRQHWGEGFDRRDAYEQEVTDLALDYSLMSQYTSFVAVEQTVRNHDGELWEVDVPVETPEFVDFGAVADEDDRAQNFASAPSRGHYQLARPAPPPVSPSPAATAAAESVSKRGLLADPQPMQDGAAGLGTRGSGIGGGGYGRGSGFYGKKGGDAPKVGPGDPIVLGSLDKSLIDRTVKKHLAQIRYCYERELKTDPSLAGKVTMKFVIEADGSVSSAIVKSTTLGSETVEACLSQRLLRMRFPAPKGGGIVIVNYPFVFQVADD